MVTLENVHKTYTHAREEVAVLRGVNLSLQQGDTCAIVGESGCGKTTLLSLIGGIEGINEGRIWVHGQEVNRLSESQADIFRSRTVGFVFQLHLLMEDFTVRENVMIPAILTGTPRAVAREKAQNLLALMELQKREQYLPHELSGGECQRVAVARALINDPQVILADEPTGSLDEKNAVRVTEVLFRLVAQFQKTMVLVTHNQSLSARTDLQYALHEGVLHPL